MQGTTASRGQQGSQFTQDEGKRELARCATWGGEIPRSPGKEKQEPAVGGDRATALQPTVGGKEGPCSGRARPVMSQGSERIMLGESVDVNSGRSDIKR